MIDIEKVGKALEKGEDRKGEAWIRV